MNTEFITLRLQQLSRDSTSEILADSHPENFRPILIVPFVDQNSELFWILDNTIVSSYIQEIRVFFHYVLGYFSLCRKLGKANIAPKSLPKACKGIHSPDTLEPGRAMNS